MPILDYENPRNAVKPPKVAIACIFVLYVIAGLLALAPGGLHNEHGFLIVWIPLVLVAVPVLLFVRRRVARTQRGTALRSVCTVLFCLGTIFGLLGLSDAVFGTDPHGIASERNDCASNVRQIGGWIWLYQQSHNGRNPPNLNALLSSYDEAGVDFQTGANSFVCPSSKDTPTTAPTTQAAVAALTSGGHCSYIYIGASFNDKAPATTVLLYEKPGHHRHGDFITVLYADCSAAQVQGAAARKLISNLQAGINPPPP